MPGSAPIAVIDHGTGNLTSLLNAFDRLGVGAERVGRPPDGPSSSGFRGAVLPGVGAFPNAARALRERGWWEWILDWASAGRPLLGVCLGMQLLFDRSDEMGGDEGLGLISGSVRALDAKGERMPHIGWTEVDWQRDSIINSRLGRITAMYHVHSFACSPSNEEHVLATAIHGSRFVTSAWNGSNVFGVQFHPEKSADEGLELLAGFASGCETA